MKSYRIVIQKRGRVSALPDSYFWNLSFGLCFSFAYRSRLTHWFSDLTPDQKNRYSRRDNYQSRPCLSRLIDKQHQQNHCGADNIKNRNNRISECLVWALDVGFLNSQP